jgi:hypothetical protein
MKQRFGFTSLFLALIVLLSACFRAPAPTENLDTQSVTSTLPTNGASSVSINASIKFNFASAMDRVATERAVTVFQGKYQPTSNPATFTKLQLTSMCDGKWRVRNTNTFPLSFTWDAYNTTEKGVGVVQGSSDAFFYTNKGSKTVRVFIGTQQQQVKSPNSTACTDIPYIFTWANDKSLAVKPTQAFLENTDYTVVLSTAAKNASGTILTTPYILGFKTSNSDLLEPARVPWDVFDRKCQT